MLAKQVKQGHKVTRGEQRTGSRRSQAGQTVEAEATSPGSASPEQDDMHSELAMYELLEYSRMSSSDPPADNHTASTVPKAPSPIDHNRMYSRILRG